jgi:hypothetical protein
LRGEVLGLLDGLDDVLIKPFVPDGTIVTLDIGEITSVSAYSSSLPLM